MVHFLYPQFRGNPADRERRLIFEEAGADKPPVEPAPVEAQGEAAPVSAESAEPAAVLEKKDAAVDATQKEVDATPAPGKDSPEPLIVEGTGGKKLGVLVASRLPGNEGKTEKDFDNAQPKKGEEKDILTGQPPTKAPDTAKETAEPVDAAVTNEQMESVAYQDMGLDGIPKEDVTFVFSPDRTSADVYSADGTVNLGTVEFAADGEVSGTTPNVEAIATLKQKTEAKDKAADATKEKGEKASNDPEMDKLGKQVDEGVRDLEKAKTPAEALAALGKILSAIIEMVKRTLGMDTEENKEEGAKTAERSKDTKADTSTESGLRAELKDRGATSIEDQREELKDLREKAEKSLEKGNETVSEIDADVDELQTKKDTVDDQIQSVRKQLIDIEQGQSEGDTDKLRSQLKKLEAKSERIQKKIDERMEVRRKLVELNKFFEKTLEKIDALERKLNSLENAFDKIEQALQKKFDVTVKIERDDGKTIFNVTTLGEGTPVWFREFAEEHDQDQNPGNGYQIDPTNAELLSKMPESKPLDTTEEPAEDSGEGSTEKEAEESPDEPAGDGAEEGGEESKDEGAEDGAEKNVDQLVQDFTASAAILRDALQTGGNAQAAVDQLNQIATQAREAGGDDVADVNDMLTSALENELGPDAEKVVMQEDGQLVLKPEPTETPEPATPSTEEVAQAPADEPADTPADTSTDKPADTPADTSTDKPADTPTDAPADTPAGEPEAAPAEDPTASENTPDATPAGTEIGNERLLELTRWAENIQANADKAGYNVMVSLDQQNGTLLIQETDGSAETDMPKILAFAQAHELVPQGTDFGDSTPPARQLSLNVTGKLDGLGYYGGDIIDSADSPRAKQIEAAKVKVAEEMQQADPVADDLKPTA